MTPDRLSELETWLPEEDTPDDAKIRIPAGDLRDLVALIPVVRAVVEAVDAGDSGALEDAAIVLVELRKGRG